MSNYLSKYLFAFTGLFILLMLIGISSLTLFAIRTNKTTTHAANISHYVVPIIFKASDEPSVTLDELAAVYQELNDAKDWYAQKTGQTF